MREEMYEAEDDAMVWHSIYTTMMEVHETAGQLWGYGGGDGWSWFLIVAT